MTKKFIDLIDEIPKEVTRLAYELHGKNDMEVYMDSSSSEGVKNKEIEGVYLLKENNLKFISINAKNFCVALHVYRNLEETKTILDSSNVFDAALSLWNKERDNSDLASVVFLGLISKKVNVICFAKEIIISTEGYKVFEILRSLGNALPMLVDVDIEDLIALVNVQYAKTSGDVLEGDFYNKVSKYFSTQPLKAKNLCAIVRKNMTKANKHLYCVALNGMAMSGGFLEAMDIAIDDSASDDLELIKSAIWAIGVLSKYWEEDQDLKNAAKYTLKKLSYHSDEHVCLETWYALSRAAANDPELISELLNVAYLGKKNAIEILSNFVFMNLQISKNHKQFSEIMNAFTDLEIGKVQNFDAIISLLIENGSYNELVENCLTKWIIKHRDASTLDEKFSSSFPQSIMKLSKSPLLNILLTNWLNSDDKILGSVYSELVGTLWVHGFKKPVLDKNTLDTLNANDYKYLARRLLGWTFHEEPLLSLIFSLLNTKDAEKRTFNLFYSILVENVGRDYPAATLEMIEERLKVATDTEKQIFIKVQSQILAYTEAISHLPERQELHPPINLRRAIFLIKTRKNREIMNRADDQSISQIFSHVPIKVGTGCFSINRGEVRPVNRLASHSVSISLPAQSVIDPLNDEITRLGLKIANRGDE